MSQKIFLDVDGVLADFWKGFVKEAHLDVPEHYRPETREEARVHCPHGWEQAAPSNFWANLPKTPWADEVVAMCHEYTDEVIICTSVHWMAGIEGRIAWFKKHPELIPKSKEMLFVSHKGPGVCPGLLIDDMEDNMPEIIFPAWDNQLRNICQGGKTVVLAYFRHSLEHYAK